MKLFDAENMPTVILLTQRFEALLESGPLIGCPWKLVNGL